MSVAKELVESTAKLVLRSRGVAYTKSDDVPALVARAQESLGLNASGVDVAAPEAKALRRILQSLTSLTQRITELRNQVGTGHGRASVPTWVRPRHARLAAGASQTWCQLMLETLEDPDAPWRSPDPDLNECGPGPKNAGPASQNAPAYGGAHRTSATSFRGLKAAPVWGVRAGVFSAIEGAPTKGSPPCPSSSGPSG